jgi:hypothetical protein
MATDKNFVIKNGLTVNGSEVITSAGNLTNIGTINSGSITSSGRIKTTNGLFQADEGNQKFRQYEVSSGSGTQTFLLGKIETSGGPDGGVTGTVKAAYDYGDTVNNCNIHFTFAQRSGTARGHWWYENTDDDASTDVISVRLVDDGSGGMFVWLYVGDYVNCFVEAVWRQCSSVTDSGTLSAGTITTGTTLFDTANNPTSEHHIGKLYAHNDITVNTLSSGNQITIQSPTPSIEFIDANATTRKARISAENGNLLFEADTNTGEANTDITFKMDGANALSFNNSKNATFAGTISSGAITSSGTLSLGSYFQAGTSVSAGFYQDSANGAYRATGTSSTRGFYFQSNAGANTYMYVGLTGTYAGRVGVGTASPAEQFHATGVARVGSLKIDATTIVDSSRNLTNIANISATGTGTTPFTFTGTSSSLVHKIGSATQTSYTSTIWETNDGLGQIWKTGSAYTAWGGADALNIYNSNGNISFHPSATQSVLQLTSTAINATKPIQISGTTVIDTSRNLTNIGTISSGAITSSGVVSMVTRAEIQGSWRLGIYKVT